MRLKKSHIQEEYADCDGYWIELHPGWKSDDDPIGYVHGIHEDTKKEAYRYGVLPCDCEECFELIERDRKHAEMLEREKRTGVIE